MEEESRELLERLNAKIDPKEKVKDLGNGQQKMIEIAKALSVDTQVIVFDELTRSLTNKEIEELFRLIRFLKENDVSIFYLNPAGNKTLLTDIDEQKLAEGREKLLSVSG